jgi:hypothetical protein
MKKLTSQKIQKHIDLFTSTVQLCHEVGQVKEVEQPVETVEEVVSQLANKPLSGQELIIKTLQDATGQIKENEKVLLTKADIGRTIFEEELQNGLVRKTVINRLMTEALLTKNGASTYFQNMKKKAGLVHSNS